MADATTASPVRPLLPELFTLLAAQRSACRQARTAARGSALAVGWLAAFGRHTITQLLLTLGHGEADWTAWHRLFSRQRIDAETLSRCLLEQTLAQSTPTDPYLLVVDGVQVPRHSRTMPGTSWLRHLGTPVFRPGIHRAQRFLDLAWLPLPSPDGYSRAVPLCLDPAFPAKAIPAPGHPPRTEGAAALARLTWARQALDQADRHRQRILGLGDGNFSSAGLWAGLPERVDLLARCAKNRALFALPPPPAADAPPRRGRPRAYGDRQPRPDAWLAERAGWRHTTLRVRGRDIPLQYRQEGPCLVRGAPQRPLFLLVVKGSSPGHGRKARKATFWLVSAVPDERAGHAGQWMLPAPGEDLLAWAWQRWEVEVAHRELKTTFGLGEPQGWSPGAAVLTVQWAAWLYGVVVLAGLRAWGQGPAPIRSPGRWWAGAGRWSLARLWQGLRQELWGDADFRAVCCEPNPTWEKMEAWLALRTNAVLAASRT
jgi:hypothetical protein